MLNRPTLFVELNEPQHAPPVPWNPRDVLWGIVAAGGLLLLFVLVGALARDRLVSLDPGLIVMVGTLLVLLPPVWYLTIFRYGVRWADLGLRPFPLSVLGIGLSLFALFFVINIIYAAILASFGLEIQPDIMGPLFADGAFPILLVVGAVVVAPLAEEIFFRGFILPGLRRKWGWKIAIVASAGLFALAHGLLTSLLPIFLLGVIFAYLYQISGSIWPGILLHSLLNSLTVLITYAISQGWLLT